MFSIQTIAFIALLARVGSDIFIGLVLFRQYKLFKLPITDELRHFRFVLFLLSLGIFIGNLIPIILDIATIYFGGAGRPTRVSLPSASYVESNAITSLISAYFIWKLYRLAAATKDITDYTQHSLETKNDILTKDK
jgi:hypothetical protein